MTGEYINKQGKEGELAEALAKVQTMIFIEKVKYKRGLSTLTSRFNAVECAEKLEGLYIDKYLLEKKLREL